MTDASPSSPQPPSPSPSSAVDEQQHQHPSQLEDHYDTVATRYQSAWFYEDGTDYQSWLLETLLPRLQPLPSHRVVDLGGGTGNFSAALHRRCQLEAPVVCVDPSAGLLEQAKQHPEVETLLADGLGFVKLGKNEGEEEEEGNTYRYDRLLLKEVVHHFAQEELPEFFAGVYRQMLPDGRVVIMTRPHDSSHYPFFTQAHQAWSAAQLHEDIYAQALKEAGFVVKSEHADYRVEMRASRWLAMVKGAFWSNLHGFSEGEMERGLEEVKGLFQEEGSVFCEKSKEGEGGEEEEDPMIHFPDRIVFITGVKKGEGWK